MCLRKGVWKGRYVRERYVNKGVWTGVLEETCVREGLEIVVGRKMCG